MSDNIQVMNNTFLNSKGAEYGIERNAKDTGWIVTRKTTGSQVTVTQKMVDKTRDLLEQGEPIGFRKISYTVAIEQAVVYILADKIKIDPIRRIYVQGKGQWEENFSKGDGKCCTVNTLSYISGLPFEECQDILAEKAGRVKGKGLPMNKWLPVYKEYCEMEDINIGHAFSGMQVRTFFKHNIEMMYGKTLVIRTNRHVFAVKNARVMDWMDMNRRHPIQNVWIATKK